MSLRDQILLPSQIDAENGGPKNLDEWLPTADLSDLVEEIRMRVDDALGYVQAGQSDPALYGILRDAMHCVDQVHTRVSPPRNRPARQSAPDPVMALRERQRVWWGHADTPDQPF